MGFFPTRSSASQLKELHTKHITMSKFWGGDSSEEEEEEEDFFSESEEEGDDEDKGDPSSRAGRWVQGAAYGSDDEEEKREVRAKHERVNDSMQKSIETLRTAMSENNWNTISKEFDDLSKIHQKWLVAWNRSEKQPAPQYVALLADLEDFHTKCYADNKYKKNLSNTNKKSLNGMQQKMRRNNTPYKKSMDHHRERKKLVEAGELEEDQLIEEVTKEETQTTDAEDSAEPQEEEIEWTPALVDEELTKILASRGRKGYDRQMQMSNLKNLLENAQNDFQRGQILLQIIGALFDTATIASHLSTKVWNDCIAYLEKLLQLIRESPDVVKSKNSIDSQTLTIDIRSNIYHHIERLEQEFFKSLQDIDSQKVTSYIKRMRDVTKLLEITDKVAAVYAQWNDNNVRVISTLIKMKYQHQSIRLNERGDAQIELADAICEGMVTCSLAEIEEMAKVVFKHGNERQKTHAMIYYITFLANHDHYTHARNYMLMSHIQETISNADVESQIMFNRAMAFLGLAAFRQGEIADAHNCLVDLYSNMKYKELLAQGVTRHEKDAEQEKIESRRQMPYHMHINTEILETVYFVSAILLEIPHAAHVQDSKRKPVSKILRKYLEANSRQIFAGPPEQPRDFFVAAAKALSRGDWKKCCNLLFGLSVWEYMADSENLMKMIRQQVKEQGLRTYIFSAASNYDSLSADRLSNMFELEASLVQTMVSKMIMSGELAASWDETTTCIIMQRAPPCKLQSLSLQFADRAGMLMENNEKLIEVRSNYGSNERRDPQWNRKYNNKRNYRQNN